MNNAHKSLRKKNNTSNTFSKYFVKVLPNFFIPESNGSAINSSSENRLYISSVQETQNVFHTDRPMKDSGISNTYLERCID